MTSEPFTDPWVTRYNEFGSPAHLHAIGVVAATYNLMEDLLSVIFRQYVKTDEGSAKRLFFALTNNARLDITRNAVDEFEPHQGAKDGLKFYMRCFDICAENRNFLMHSVAHQSFEEGIFNFLKQSSRDPLQMISYALSTKQIREIADTNFHCLEYGYMMQEWASALTRQPPLEPEYMQYYTSLERPQLPRKLSLICREVQQAEPLRPRSSDPSPQTDK